MLNLKSVKGERALDLVHPIFIAHSFTHYDSISNQNLLAPSAGSSSTTKLMEMKPSGANTAILKPKPLPMPRPYLKQQQLSLAPTLEDDHEDDEVRIPFTN